MVKAMNRDMNLHYEPISKQNMLLVASIGYINGGELWFMMVDKG